MARAPGRHRAGLLRLGEYITAPRRHLIVLFTAAGLTAAAQAGGWLLVKDAVDNGMRAGDETRLWIDVSIYVAINAAAWALGSYVIRGLAAVGQGIVLELRRHLFSHLSTLSLRYFSQTKAGWIIARLTSDIDALSDVLSEGLKTLIANTLVFVVAIAALFAVDWRLALVALVVMPPALVFTRWFQVRSSVAFGEVRNRIAAVTAQMAESLAGMAVIQAFNREPSFRLAFEEMNDANKAANIRAQTLWAVFFPAIEWLGIVATAAVLWVGANLVHDGSRDARHGDRLHRPARPAVPAAAGALGALRAGAVGGRRDGQDRRHPRHRDRHRLQARRAARCRGSRAASTSTTSRSRTAPSRCCTALDVHVPAGGCLALVGESGGGKSTTAKLIARFYDPAGGAVRVDGHDLRDVDLASYRRQLGVVLQDPFLFSGTIADNIRFARPEATDEEVEEVARAIGVDIGRGAARRRPPARGARGRLRPVGRRAAADLDRPRAARRSAHPDPRRGDLEHRPADRAADRARARPPARAAARR